jgi:3-phenylpropionate/cinnamic acid dioxygenase small subunit
VVSDRERVIEVAVRYCTAIDERDWDLLGRCFLADAVVSYPGFEPLHGVTALTEFLAGLLTPLDATQHIVTNFTVEVEGDEASCSCYLHAQHVRESAPGGSLFVFAGTYRDTLRRGEDGWRIARRDLTTTWVDGNSEVLG